MQAIALAIVLSVFAFTGTALAQDAAKAEAAVPAAKPSDPAPEHPPTRAERRQAEAAAKRTEAATGVKTDSLSKFPKADEANAAAAKPKMECRKQEVTGSRLGKTICATPEQWAESDAAAAEAVRQMRSDVDNKAGITRPGANPFGGAVGR